MTGTKWWDLAFGATIAVLAALTQLAWAPTAAGRAIALAILGVLVLAYLLIGRRALADGRHAIPYSLLLIVASGALAACSPNLAVAQVITIPLLWSVIESTARSVVATVVAAVAVAVGIYFSLGADSDALSQAVSIQGISLVGSIAFGIWISRIASLSHERKRLLDELTASQDRVAALSRDAGMLGERERLAREIHDTIAQDLTGLVMLSQRAQRELGDSPEGTLALLEESARSALAETRALVAASAPVGLSSGIREALDRLAERISRETGVTVGVEVGDDVPALDRDTEVVLLRIAQEGLGNVRKHANADSAVVRLEAGNGHVALVVEDDGDGFDPTRPTEGFGLTGMHERLALVGGTIDVSTSPAGTVLTATLPVPA